MEQNEKKQKIREMMKRLNEETLPNDETRQGAEQVLALDPNHPGAKLALWCSLDTRKQNKRLNMLRNALTTACAATQGDPDAEDTKEYMKYRRGILASLAYALSSFGRPAETLEYAKELAELDEMDLLGGRRLLYSCMLELEQYEEILERAEADMLQPACGLHASAIAMVELGKPQREISKRVLYAIARAPEIPFLILEIWDFSSEDMPQGLDSEQAELDASFLQRHWRSSKKRMLALAEPTMLFGCLSGRLPEKWEKRTIEKYREEDLENLVNATKEKIAQMAARNEAPEAIDAFANAQTTVILDTMYDAYHTTVRKLKKEKQRGINTHKMPPAKESGDGKAENVERQEPPADRIEEPGPLADPGIMPAGEETPTDEITAPSWMNDPGFGLAGEEPPEDESEAAGRTDDADFEPAGEETLQDEIEELVGALYDDSNTQEKKDRLTARLLQLDPDNPMAKFVEWAKHLDDEDDLSCIKHQYLLQEALDEARRRVTDAYGIVDLGRDPLYAACYLQCLTHTGFQLLELHRSQEAIACADEIIAAMGDDDDDRAYSRLIRYCGMLQLQQYKEIIESVENDPYADVPAAAYAKVFAMLELGRPAKGIRLALQHAVLLYPEIIFVYLGFWERPDDMNLMSDDTRLAATFAHFFSLCWKRTKGRGGVMFVTALFFGYLTDRLTRKELINQMNFLIKNTGSGLRKKFKTTKQECAAMLARDEDPKEVDKVAMQCAGEILAKLDDSM